VWHNNLIHHRDTSLFFLSELCGKFFGSAQSLLA